MFGKYDGLVDGANDVRWLSNPEIAAIVKENLYHHHGGKYELLAYCIMPNHVHAVIQPFESALMSLANAADVGRISPYSADDNFADELVGDFSTFMEMSDRRTVLSGIITANRANKVLRRSGAFWQKESYDHWIRDLDELERIVAYVAFNPVLVGLCNAPHEWQASSAYDRFQRDGATCALVGWLRDDWRR